MSDKLAAIIRAAQREHGEALVKLAEDTRAANVFRISTGIFILDYAIGGGIPIGRTSIVYGKKSAGKSSLMAKVIANAQRMCRKCLGPVVIEAKDVMVPSKKVSDNGTVVDVEVKVKKHVAVDCVNKCRVQEVDDETRKPKGKEYWPGPMHAVWVDAEGSFHVGFYTSFGVDCGLVHLVNTEYGEQAIDLVDSMIRTGQVDLIVVDSIAALTPLKEREKSSEDWQVALQARIINKAMRVWTSSLNELEVVGKPTDCTILLSNQTRQKPGQYFPVEVLPAGVGQEFTSSLEIRLKQKTFQFDSGGRPLWQETQFIIEKNRCGVPKMQGFYRMCLLEHPGRKPGDTWDDVVVSDQALAEGFVKEADKKLLCIGKKFETEAAFRDEVSKMGDLYHTLRSRLLELMIGRPSTGELAKEKEKDKDK